MTTLSRSLAPALAILALALAIPSSADAAMTATGKPKVSFFAAGSPGALDIEGETSSLTAAEVDGKLTFTVPMSTVKTGIDLRDEHMNDKFVQVGTFPNAILTVDRAAVTWPAALAEAKTGTVPAVFNIHGVDQPVSVEYTIQKSKTGYRVRGKFAFDVTKSGIAIPDYLGVTVDPKMTAEVQVDLVDG